MGKRKRDAAEEDAPIKRARRGEAGEAGDGAESVYLREMIQRLAAEVERLRAVIDRQQQYILGVHEAAARHIGLGCPVVPSVPA